MSKSSDQYESLNSIQVKAIQSMFRFYDLDLTGKITKERAQKILQRIGIDPTAPTMHTVVNLKELLEYIDHHLPEPDPPLQSELTSFIKLVAKHDESTDMKPEPEGAAAAPFGQAEAAPVVNNPYSVTIKPKNIIDFFESTDQPIPNSAGVVHQLMTSMQDWDDCRETPSIPPAIFVRDLTKFAKKTNALRDFV
jgi:hypothetical protein